MMSVPERFVQSPAVWSSLCPFQVLRGTMVNYSMYCYTVSSQAFAAMRVPLRVTLHGAVPLLFKLSAALKFVASPISPLTVPGTIRHGLA